MKILITGSAGFIGFHLAVALLKSGNEVVGIDNINNYYDIELKYARLSESGICKSEISWNRQIASNKYPLYRFIRMNLEDKIELFKLCEIEAFDIIINLAAQAGVRYSIENPDAYIQSNIVGFLNILEACRNTGVKHLVYASSSSVYGLNSDMPFSTSQKTDTPVSLYGATKKSNELMAHSYSHLYHIRTTGLRFFTVYGPWGRPDMAYYLFAEAILNKAPIKIFNYGQMRRDFTYIDDIIAGIVNVIHDSENASVLKSENMPMNSSQNFAVYNIGNNKPVALLELVNELESALCKKAVKEFTEMQNGDVLATWADIGDMAFDFKFEPRVNLKEGISEFINWFKIFKTQSIAGSKQVSEHRIENYNLKLV